MSAKDTSLLGEILSVQKALLAKMNSEDKDKKDKKKEATVEGAEGGVGGFGELLKELQDLNKTSKKQLEVLEKIDKNTAGGTGSSGGGSLNSLGSAESTGEKLSTLGAGMVTLAIGILALVGGMVALALVSVVAPMAVIGAVSVGLIVYGFYKLFKKVGDPETEEQVDKGLENLFRMAGGIAIFTLAVVASTLAMEAVGGGKIIKDLVLVLIGFGGIFFLLGKGGDSIKDGAKAAVWMGLGMAAVGLGVLAMVWSLKQAGDILSGGTGSVIVGGLAALGIIAVSGLVFGILGEFKGPIIAGAMTVAVIGLGLAVFGLGLAVYLTQIAKVMGVGGAGVMGGTEIKGGFFNTLGSMLVGLGIIAVGAMTLILYGTIFALAGQLELGIPIMMLYGAGAFAAVGLGLAIFGFGLDYYLGVVAKNAGVGGEGDGMDITADSFVSGVVVMGSALGYLIGMGVIFALAGTVSPLIGLGAAAMAGIGLAMASLGWGIAKFIEYVPPGTKIGEELKDSLSTIKDAFLALVDDEPEGGLLGFADSIIGGGLVGAITGGGKLAVAIGVAIGLGPALSSIAQGIGAWADLQNIPKVTGYDKMGQPIFDPSATANVETALDNLTKYLPGIVQPFIDLSNKADLSQEASILSVVTGLQLAESPFARGVSIAGGIGPVLTSIAAGIGAFADLQQAPKFLGYDAKGQPILDTANVINLTEAAGNIGTALTSILKPFIDLSNTANLGQESSLLSIITGVQLAESPFARGVSIAGNIGAVLTSIAQGIGSFADLQNAPKISGYDKMGQPVFDTSAAPVSLVDSTANIAKVLDPDGEFSIVKPFVDLANNAALKEGTSYLKILIGTDFGDSPFQRGIGLVGKIGNVLSSLAQGIGVFHNLTAAPKISGYDKMGQPTYDGTTVDVVASIGGLAKILSPDGDESIVKPFVDLATSAALKKPFSVVGFLSEVLVGASTGESDFEKGLRLALSMGEVISNLGSGIGQLANLSAVPVISGYDANGRATYGTPVNAMDSMKNLGILIGDLIEAFADASKNMSPYADPESMSALGPMVGGILGGIVDAIDVFSNPDKLKKITGYDAKGKAIYSTTEFVNVDTVIGNMIAVITRIVKALANEEIVDALDELDLADDGMEIGPFLEQFIKPLEAIGKIESTYGGVHNIGYRIGESIKYIISASKVIADSDFEDNIEGVVDGLDSYVDIMEELQTVTEKQVDPFAAIFSLNVVNPDDIKRRSNLQQFTDEITRLAGISSPFEKFANSFGKMSKDMRIFAENFKLMDSDGIMAFEKWTTSIVQLSTANPSTFAANVVTANKAIDAGFNVGEDPGIVDIIVDTFNPNKKKETINKAVNPTTGNDGKPAAPQKIDYAAIGKAVAAALQSATLDVNLVSDTRTGKNKGRGY